MCGIAGIWMLDGSDVSPICLNEMSRAIRHRGPNDCGHVLIDTRGQISPAEFGERPVAAPGRDLGLANRRLSIIDLSSAGHQPMTFKHLTIVYNGEVYNYRELSETLSRLGHTFRSHSDTEVLLHAWAQWGTECLQHLNGIFVFAMWDARTGSLSLVRDRLGVKPLYCCLTERRKLIFCSELKGILAAVTARPEVNEALVFDFLTSGRQDHTDQTFFSGVHRVPAGHVMELTPAGRKTWAWWTVPLGTVDSGSFEEHSKRFHDLFFDAISLEMRADVPVACCLSGGLDSSAVVSVAVASSGGPIRTYTARFDDQRMDEWRWAETVHRAKPVIPVAVVATPEGFVRDLDALIDAQEEPFGGPGVYAQWLLMKRIHEDGVRVVLDGQGGDELLCGYAKYFYFALFDLWRERRVAELAASALRAFRFGGGQLLNLAGARRYLPAWWMGRHQRHTLQPDFAGEHAGRSIAHPSASVADQQRLDLQRFSLPALLRYEDKNSMAHSIESRVPFLDHRLVELAMQLPTEHKIYGGESKRVLRHGLVDAIPGEILRRRSKLGFGGTWDSWIHALRPEFDSWLARPARRVDKYLLTEALARMLKQKDLQLFRALILDRWLERFAPQ